MKYFKDDQRISDPMLQTRIANMILFGRPLRKQPVGRLFQNKNFKYILGGKISWMNKEEKEEGE
jgi:hypothetical protein